MIVYKVARRESADTNVPKWISAAVSEPEVQLEYRIGKVTRAKPGSMGVFIFTKLADAQRWRKWVEEENVIFQCEASEEVMRPKWIVSYRDVSTLLRKITGHKISWSRRQRWFTGKLSHLLNLYAPSGSGTVKYVKPMKLVQ